MTLLFLIHLSISLCLQVTVLVAGSGWSDVATAAAAVEGVVTGVTKVNSYPVNCYQVERLLLLTRPSPPHQVIKANGAVHANIVAENITGLVVDVAKAGVYTHIMASTSNFANNFVPRSCGCHGHCTVVR